MLLAESELSLPGGIEWLVRTFSGGGLEGPGRHLRCGGQGSDQEVLCGRNLGLWRGFDGGGAGSSGVAEFLPQDTGVDTHAVSNLLRQPVADNAAWHPLDVRKQVVQGLNLAVGATYGERGSGAFDQVVEVFLRAAQGFLIGGFPLAAQEEVRVESGIEGQDLDLEVLLDQKPEGAFGGGGAGRVGIEIDHDVLGKAP